MIATNLPLIFFFHVFFCRFKVVYEKKILLYTHFNRGKKGGVLLSKALQFYAALRHSFFSDLSLLFFLSPREILASPLAATALPLFFFFFNKNVFNSIGKEPCFLIYLFNTTGLIFLTSIYLRKGNSHKGTMKGDDISTIY